MRYEDLLQRIDGVAANALNSLSEDEIEEALPHISSWRSKGKVLSEMKRFFHKYAAENMENVLIKYNLNERLNELETAISEARIRQRMYQGQPELAPPDERPVVLARLTPAQLVDAKLAPSRKEWLEELHQRSDEADTIEAELAQSIEARRTQLAEREAAIRAKLAVMSEAAQRISRRVGPRTKHLPSSQEEQEMQEEP